MQCYPYVKHIQTYNYVHSVVPIEHTFSISEMYITLPVVILVYLK